MNVQVKSCNGITMVPIEARLLSERKIFLEGAIDQNLACEFVKQMMLLTAEDESKPIDVLINSPGGEINAGLLIYDVIQSCKVPIRMFCIGRAYSMAAVLFASGQNGRYMLENSELMLHEPLISDHIGGSTSSIKTVSDSLIKVKQKLNKILSKHTGKTEKIIAKETQYDHYFNPQESIKFGLCDEIVGFKEIMEV